MSGSDGELTDMPWMAPTTENIPASESGINLSRPAFPSGRMLVVLSAEELAAAITKAHSVKMDPSDFALRSAMKILEILPPIYYEPRND